MQHRKALGLLKSLPPNFRGLDALNPVVVYLMGCRQFNQFCCTWRAIEDPERFCPFCPTELTRRRREPTETEGGWILLENEFPRQDARMFLVVPRRHLTSDDNLGTDDWQDIGKLHRSCKSLYNIPGGGLLMRFGDPRDHAGTIQHLHMNVIQPTREGGCTLPLAKSREAHQEDYARLRDFVAQIEARGGVLWLFSEEGVLETQPPVMVL